MKSKYTRRGKRLLHAVESNYLQAGKFRLRIELCKRWISDQGSDCFIVEFLVLDSDNPKVLIGERRGWVAQVAYEHVIGGIRNFLSVALHKDSNSLEWKDADDVVSAENPLRGIILHATVSEKKTVKGRVYLETVFSSPSCE